MLTDQQAVLDALWHRVDVLNFNRAGLDATDEEWRYWFEAHIARRVETQRAGERETRNVPRQIAYFQRKIEELAEGPWIKARRGYWNT